MFSSRCLNLRSLHHSIFALSQRLVNEGLPGCAFRTACLSLSLIYPLLNARIRHSMNEWTRLHHCRSYLSMDSSTWRRRRHLISSRGWHGCDRQGHDGLTSAFLWSWQPREWAKKIGRQARAHLSSAFYLGKHSRRQDQDRNKWEKATFCPFGLDVCMARSLHVWPRCALDVSLCVI